MSEILMVPVEKILERFKKVHGVTYDYSLVKDNYKGIKRNVPIICNKHGVFYQTPQNHYVGQRCPKCVNESARKYDRVYLNRNAISSWIKQQLIRYPDLVINYNNELDKRDVINCECKIHGRFTSALSGICRDNYKGCRKCYLDTKSNYKERFLKKAMKLYGDRFDYSKMRMSEYKPIIICRKHNIEFRQERRNHLRYIGCPKCVSEHLKHDTDEYIKKAKEIHGNKYSYEKTKYIGSRDKVIVTCPIHGDFKITACEHIRKKRNATGCRYCACRSEAEAITINYLNSLGIKYEYQYMLPGYKYRWDFVVNDVKLAIEVDDIGHTTDFNRADKDIIKNKLMEKLGYITLRIKDYPIKDYLPLLKHGLSKYIKYIKDNKCFRSFKQFADCYNLPMTSSPSDYKEFEFKPNKSNGPYT